MPESAFETEIEQLFSQAGPSAGDEAFVHSVTARTGKLRRAGGLLPTVATAVGALVVVLELSQPSLWVGVADWLNRVGAPLADPKLWTTPNPMFSAAVIGTLALGVYLARVLREN